MGGAYIFSGVYGGLSSINVDTKKVLSILTSKETGAIYNVSGDGAWVAYETFANGPAYYYPRMDKEVVKFNGLILKNLIGGSDRQIEHRKGYERFGNAIFSPDSNLIAYEEEKGVDPENRQYDAVVENVSDGGSKAIFANCSLASNEWEKELSPWLDNQYLLIVCNENYYKVDTKNGAKEKIEVTDGIGSQHVSSWNDKK